MCAIGNGPRDADDDDDDDDTVTVLVNLLLMNCCSLIGHIRRIILCVCVFKFE